MFAHEYKSNSPDSLAPKVQKDSSTHMHGLAANVKEGPPFARDLSLEYSSNFYLCFWMALLPSVFYFFFLYWLPSSALCTVFDSISSNINEVLSINPSANVFLFVDFNVLHKNWLTYSGGPDRPVYILIKKCQVKPHSYSWFSAACAPAIIHRNYFFHMYQNDRSSGS